MKKATQQKKKNRIGLVAIIAALVGAGALGGSFALANAVANNQIRLPFETAKFANTYAGVRISNDGETAPVRLGAAKDFKAGINGAINDFDNYPIYHDMKAEKDANGNYFVTVKEHYASVVVSEGYTDYKVSKQQIDNTFKLVPEYKIACYQGNVTFDSKGNGTMHSVKDAYPAYNYTKLQGVEYAKNANSYLNTYDNAMDFSMLQTIEFATNDLQTIFKGFTDSVNFTDTIILENEIQDTKATNVVRVRASVIDALLDSGEKITDRIIPGLSSIVLQDKAQHAGSDVRTVKSIRKVNFALGGEEESSSSASASSSEDSSVTRVNCYEIAFDGSAIKGEDMLKAIAKERANLSDEYSKDDDLTNEDVYINIGNYVKSGLTDGLSGTSHELREINGVEIPEGSRPFSYRGVENWWGNVAEWLDGVQATAVSSADENKYGGFLEICHDKKLMGESDAANANTPDYVTLCSITGGNYVSSLFQAEDTLGIALQNKKAGSLNDAIFPISGEKLMVGDDTFEIRPVCRGGTSFGGDAHGAFFLHCQNQFDEFYYAVGGRLGN